MFSNYLNGYFKRKWSRNFDFLLLIVTLIQSHNFIDWKFTRHQDQTIAIQEGLIAIGTCNAQIIFRGMHFLNENLTWTNWYLGYFEVIIGDVHLFIEFSFDGGASFPVSSTNSTLIFSRIWINNPVASNFLHGQSRKWMRNELWQAKTGKMVSLTYSTNARDAHIIRANIARCSIGSRISPRHNQRIFWISAVQFTWIIYENFKIFLWKFRKLDKNNLLTYDCQNMASIRIFSRDTFHCCILSIVGHGNWARLQDMDPNCTLCIEYVRPHRMHLRFPALDYHNHD